MPAFDECLERGDLLRRRRHHDFAGFTNGNVVLVAELSEHLVTAPRQLRLERVGCVVEAGVQDAAVAARGVGGDVGLLVVDDHIVPGGACEPCVGERETDNAPANHHEIRHDVTLRRLSRGTIRT